MGEEATTTFDLQGSEMPQLSDLQQSFRNDSARSSGRRQQLDEAIVVDHRALRSTGQQVEDRLAELSRQSSGFSMHRALNRMPSDS